MVLGQSFGVAPVTASSEFPPFVLTRPTRGSLASLRLDAPSIVRRYGWSRKLTRNSRGWPGERPISTPCASFDVENVPDISCGFPARATTGRAAFLRPRRSAPYPPPPRRRRSSPATNQPHPPPRSSSPARAKGNIWSGSVRPPRRRLRRPGTGGLREAFRTRAAVLWRCASVPQGRQGISPVIADSRGGIPLAVGAGSVFLFRGRLGRVSTVEPTDR
jgi:hypothetical protein